MQPRDEKNDRLEKETEERPGEIPDPPQPDETTEGDGTTGSEGGGPRIGFGK